MSVLFSLDLTDGNGNGVQKIFKISTFKDEIRFDIREWKDGRPTKRGISMKTLRFVAFMQHVEAIGKALKKVMENKVVDERVHIGGPLYASIKDPYWNIDIREFFIDDGVRRPTRRGIKLKRLEWIKLENAIKDIEKVVPETADMSPCYLSDDHQNQFGWMTCRECNHIQDLPDCTDC